MQVKKKKKEHKSRGKEKETNEDEKMSEMDWWSLQLGYRILGWN